MCTLASYLTSYLGWLIILVNVGALLTESDIEVLQPPVLTSQADEEYILVLGESFSLPCEASGHPEPTYTWYHNERPFTPGPQVTTKPGTGTLLFSEMVEEYVGTYQCWAENTVGKTRTFTPIVVRKAYIDYFADDKQVESVYIGSKSKLECSPPDSLPEATIRWATGEPGISDLYHMDSLEATERIMQSLEGHLYITNVLPEDDRTTYSCSAFNSVTRAIINGPSYELRTRTDPQYGSPQEASLWWNSSPDVTVTEGDDAQLQCIFSGNPAPTVIWERDDSSLPAGRWYTLQGGTLLEIRGTRLDDTGMYTCVGFNDYTTDHVFFTISLRVIPRGPTLVSSPESQTVTEGASITMTCRALDINPEPKYTWYFNGSDTIPGYLETRVKQTKHTLTISRVTRHDAMSITCGAFSSYGTTYAHSYLAVQLKAEPAVKDAAIRLSPEFLILSASFLINYAGS